MSKKVYEELFQRIKDGALKKGIICQDDLQNEDNEYVEFVLWMSLGKDTYNTRKMFDKNNRAISHLANTLKHYSHARAEELYESKNIRRIFDYFFKNGVDWFVNSLGEDNLAAYKEELKKIQEKVALYSGL